MTAKVSLAQAPAALVDQVGEPEGHEVGVGRDVRAVDLDVVAGVGDHDEALGADDVEHPARELRAAGAAGEHDDVRVRRSLPAARRAGRVEPDAGVRLVADVDADQQRRQRLGGARHLQAPAVDAAQPVDALDQRAPPRACRRACRRTRARPGRAGARGRSSDAALTVCSAETTRTPSGTISGACCAAEPCHTPSMRVALPLTAAASGTVASISSWPGRERVLEVRRASRTGCGTGTLRIDRRRAARRVGVLVAR